jgi:hypothetical protein
MDKIADYLGVRATKKGNVSGGVTKKFEPSKRISKPAPTREDDLERIDWDEFQVKLWCIWKKPITPEALKQCGAWLARYKKTSIRVLVVPCGEKNWVIYNLTGGYLMGGKDEWIKVKCVNKYAGWIKPESSR